jgi:hypothetical protein
MEEERIRREKRQPKMPQIAETQEEGSDSEGEDYEEDFEEEPEAELRNDRKPLATQGPVTKSNPKKNQQEEDENLLALKLEEKRLRDLIASKEIEQKSIELELVIQEQDELMAELDQVRLQKCELQKQEPVEVESPPMKPYIQTTGIEQPEIRNPNFVLKNQTPQFMETLPPTQPKSMPTTFEPESFTEQDLMDVLGNQNPEDMTPEMIEAKIKILEMMEQKQQLEKSLLVAQQEKLENEMIMQETVSKQNEIEKTANEEARARTLEKLMADTDAKFAAWEGKIDEARVQDSIQMTMDNFERSKKELAELQEMQDRETEIYARLDSKQAEYEELVNAGESKVKAKEVLRDNFISNVQGKVSGEMDQEK